MNEYARETERERESPNDSQAPEKKPNKTANVRVPPTSVIPKRAQRSTEHTSVTGRMVLKGPNLSANPLRTIRPGMAAAFMIASWDTHNENVSASVTEAK